MAITRITTEWGPVWLEHDGDRLVSVRLGGRAPGKESRRPSPAITALCGRLGDYFRTGRDLPAVAMPPGLPGFRRRVYETVMAIPPGSTMTYAEVAERAGRPGAARAVGAAMAANPLPPMIPCHRVVGSDGSLRGYAGGMAMKRALLDREAVA